MRYLSLTDFIVGSVFILWLAVTAAAFYWFANKQLVDFDPNNQLAAVIAQSAQQTKFQDALKAKLLASADSLANRAFHISSARCNCNIQVNEHLNILEPWLKNKGIQLQRLDYASVRDFIPASPAIIVFNQASELIYLGPYSSGYLCNSNTSIVELAVAPALTLNNVPPMIQNKTQGCYCYS